MSRATSRAALFLALGLVLLLASSLLDLVHSFGGDGARRSEAARDGAARAEGRDDEAVAASTGDDPRPHSDDRSVTHGAAIFGRVVDRQGTPVADATVVAAFPEFGDYPYAPMRESARARSEADGSFVLGPLDLRTHDVRAVREGTGAGISYNDSPGAFVEIVLFPGASVSGRVTERATGEPLAGARVFLSMSGYRKQATTSTEGHYSFPLLPVSSREYGGTLWVVAEGFARAERDHLILRHGREERVVFRLVPGRTLRGRVVDARSGQPIPEAVVGESDDRTAVTGAEGVYVLHDVDISPNRAFTVRAEGYLPQTHQCDGTQTLDFRLHESAELAGVVRGPSGEPLSGARVRLRGLPVPEWLDFDWSLVRRNARSDSSGVFRFRSLPPGMHSVVAYHSERGFGDAGPIEIAEGGAPPPSVVVTVRDGMTVEGFVRDLQNRPLTGVHVTATFSVGQPSKWGGLFSLPDLSFDYTDAEGRFRLSGVPSGKVNVRADTRRNSSMSTQVEVEGVPGDRVRGVLLTLGGPSISGVVVDARGEPFQGATVWARGPSQRVGAAHTDARGRFSVGGLAEGSYTITVRAPFGNPEPLQDIPAGAKELRIELPPAQELTGTVTSLADGGPVDRFHVSISKAVRDNVGDELSEQRQSPDGTFAVWLAPGAYRVTIKAPGHAPRTVNDIVVEVGRNPSPLHVRLEPGALLRGVILDRSGVPVLDEEVTLTVYRNPGEPAHPDDLLLVASDTTDHQARYFFDGVAPGKYLLSMNLGSRGAVQAQVAVGGSGVVKLDLHLGE